jgi:hypothetical protein
MRWLSFVMLTSTFVVASTACGGNEPGNTSTGASLEVVEREEDPTKTLPPAPTDAHLKIAKLLPGTKARLNDSITYGGWNAEQAKSYTDKEEGDGAVKAAPIPCVRARYSSTGYEKVEGGEKNTTTAKQTYPQVADLYIIQAPAADAAKAIARKIEDQFTKQQFEKKDPLRFNSGKDGKPGPEISQFLRVDQEKERDVAHVGYIYISGSLVIYALETEVRMPLIGPNKEVIRLPVDRQMGSRVGGQLIMLVDDTLSR